MKSDFTHNAMGGSVIFTVQMWPQMQTENALPNGMKLLQAATTGKR
jgi:hypothetical protein